MTMAIFFLFIVSSLFSLSLSQKSGKVVLDAVIPQIVLAKLLDDIQLMTEFWNKRAKGAITAQTVRAVGLER